MTKLICFDMDGVIFKIKNFWMRLHEVFGTYEEGQKLTKEYLYTDYTKLVEEVVVQLWKGKDAKPYFDLINNVEYYPGVKETFEELNNKGYKTAIISCGPKTLVDRAVKDLKIDFAISNDLAIEDGKVIGEFSWPIAEGKEKKAKALIEMCKVNDIDLKDVIVIGDGDNDIQMGEIAAKTIAVHAEEGLREMADVVILQENLNEILKYID